MNGFRPFLPLPLHFLQPRPIRETGAGGWKKEILFSLWKRLSPCPVLTGFAALWVFALTGCTLQPERPAGVTKDRAFISYWPEARARRNFAWR